MAKSYDMKMIEQDQYMTYSNFGWVRSKEAAPADLAIKTKKPTFFLKRRQEYGMNPVIATNEAEYEELYKKNNKNKGCKTAFATIFGIILGILLIACFVIGAVGVVIGIDKYLEADNKAKIEDGQDVEPYESFLASLTENEAIGGILEKVDNFVNGKGFVSDEDAVEPEEGAFNLAETIDGFGLPAFLNAYVVIGIVGLILFIVFTIIFASICKMGKRRKVREQKMAAIVPVIKAEVENMRKTNLALMSKQERKYFRLENAIANGFSRALLSAKGDDSPVAIDDDDDDEF